VELLTDEAFLGELMTASGSIRPKVEVSHLASSTNVSIQREFQGEWPSLVAGLIGETLQINERRTWNAADPNGEIDGTIEMHVQGQPVTMTGTIRVSPTASGCTARISGQIQAKVPFIGGMVEKIVLEQVQAGIALEAKVLATQS
jgi:hypothetical protein